MTLINCPATQRNYNTAPGCVQPFMYADSQHCPGQFYWDSATGHLGLHDVPQALRSCGYPVACDQCQGVAAAIPAGVAPTVLYNNYRGAMLQPMQQDSICGSKHALEHHVGAFAKPPGAPCCGNYNLGPTCSSVSTSSNVVASLDLECTEALQDALDLQLVDGACSCKGISAQANSDSSVSQNSECTALDSGSGGPTVPQQAAPTEWDCSDSFVQLCNNCAEAAAICENVDGKQYGHQSQQAASSLAAAAAAGSASVGRRLQITQLSVYPESSCSSNAALAQANKIMASVALPDGIIYLPVHEDAFLFKVASLWQFPAFVVCLGSSYFQRMMARLPQMAEAVMSCPGFEEYAQHHRANEGYTPSTSPPPKLHGAAAVSTAATLRSIQLTCLFLATKVADQVHALELLRFMLSQVSSNGHVVSKQEVSDIELRCLDALDWRLGPYFDECEMQSDDLMLWAS